MTLRRTGWSFVLGLLGAGMLTVGITHAQTDGETVVGPPVIPRPVSFNLSDSSNYSVLRPQDADAGDSAEAQPVIDQEVIASACAPACEPGGPWTLFGRNQDCSKLNIGGWFSAGWHSESNDLFNSQPDSFNLHQGWLFVEKVAVSECGELGFGFRFDGMYGIDAGDTQSFGNSVDGGGNPRGWDNGPNFTRGGGYGWALPQAYVEIASGDWNVKVGHFYTLVGYEVVPAVDNFFYSHAITMYNSEPFTHTGAIASYSVNDDTTLYAGWTAGWDTGFDQFGDGSSFLGGFSMSLCEDITMTYITTFGDFGARGDEAYSHSFVFDTVLTENMNSVLQSDMVRIASTGEDSIGLNHRLIYQINNCVSFGSRSEWWKGDAVTGYAPHGGVQPATGSQSHYASTWGLNLRPNSNMVIRPEYRYNYSPALDYEEGVFGVDVVVTY